MRIRDATAVARNRGPLEEANLPAEKPVLHLKNPLARATQVKPSVASGKVYAIHKNPGVVLPEMTKAEAELAQIFAKIDAPLVAISPEVNLGDSSVLADDSALLDAALAHGNPVSRYVRTRKKEDYTRSDYTVIAGDAKHPVESPERMRRVVINPGAKSRNWIWQLLTDRLIETSILVRKTDCVLRWVPSKFHTSTYKNLTATRDIKRTIRHHPSDPIKDFEFKLGKEEKRIGSDTRNVPGFYGEDNIADEKAELLRMAGVRNPGASRFPQRMCTWIHGEDIEKLKKTANRKSFASKNERRSQNRTSWAFPSVGAYRPPPKWWWFLMNPDGRSQVYDDHFPWPTGDVGETDKLIAAQRANEEHNRRAVDWMNSARYFFSKWLFAEVSQSAAAPSLDTASEKEEAHVVEVAAEVIPEEIQEDTALEPEDPASIADLTAVELLQEEEELSVIPRKQNKATRRLNQKAKARLSRAEKKAAQRALRREKELARRTNSTAPEPVPVVKKPEPESIDHETVLSQAEEAVSQLPVLEGEYIPKEEIEESRILADGAGVLVDGGDPLPEDRARERIRDLLKALPLNERKARYAMAHLASIKEEVGPIIIRTTTEVGNFEFRPEHPGVFKAIDEAFSAAEERMALLDSFQDFLEETEEDALLMQGKMKPEDTYIPYRTRGVNVGRRMREAFAGSSSKKEPAIRKMSAADLGIQACEPGAVLFGHRLNRGPVEKNMAFSRWIRIVDGCQRTRRKRLRGETKRQKTAALVEAYQLARVSSARVEDVRWVRNQIVQEMKEEIIHHLDTAVQVRIQQLRMNRKLKSKEALKADGDRRLRKICKRDRLKRKDAHRAYVKRMNQQHDAARRLWQRYDQLHNKGGLERRAARAKAKWKRDLQVRITEKMVDQEEALVLERKLLKEKRKRKFDSAPAIAKRRYRKGKRVLRDLVPNAARAIREQILEPPVVYSTEEEGTVRDTVTAPAKEQVRKDPIIERVSSIHDPVKVVKIDGVTYGRSSGGILLPADYRPPEYRALPNREGRKQRRYS